MHSFGRLLQTYRKRWRKPDKPTLTQEEVSLHLGYSDTTYGHWERGRGRPPDRSVVVDLIQLFYSGGGIASLAEADDLLQAGSFSNLQPDEIRRIEPAWLPQSPPRTPPLPPSPVYKSTTSVPVVYQNFPTDLFCQYLQTGREIRLQNTWIPTLDAFIEPLIEALQRQARIQILLLFPYSRVAELRNEALEASQLPVLSDQVQRGVESNLTRLAQIWSRLDASQRQQLQVRFYNSLPSVSICQVDQFCLMGVYFHGRLAISSPQFEIDMTSFLGTRVNGEFNTLWGIAQPISHLDHWQRELDLLKGRFYPT
jgi:hypothetical protein